MSDNDVTIARGILTHKGKSRPIKQIGKGAFAVVYQAQDGKGEVFAVVKDDSGDHTKHILAESSGSSYYLPKIERIGWTRGVDVFQMPYYKAPLRSTDSPTAWAQFVVLKDCHDESVLRARDRVGGWGRSIIYEGHRMMSDTIACVKKAKQPKALVRALETLQSNAANHGSDYSFEFAARNAATDGRGRLVLLDPLFSQETMARKHTAARRKAGGLYGAKAPVCWPRCAA